MHTPGAVLAVCISHCVGARHLRWHEEGRNDNAERAVKHLIIADNLGMSINQECNGSIELLFEMFKKEILASKEDLAATLRAHQAAVDRCNQ